MYEKDRIELLQNCLANVLEETNSYHSAVNNTVSWWMSKLEEIDTAEAEALSAQAEASQGVSDEIEF